jgi:Na+/alanine symporter
MAFPNLIAIIFLSGKTKSMMKEYFSKDHESIKK